MTPRTIKKELTFVMLRVRQRAILAGLVIMGLAMTLNGQEVPHPEVADRLFDYKVIHQTIEFGGQWVGVEGNSSMYDTLDNRQSGPRILGGEVSLEPLHRGEAFDSIVFTGFGFGGDPNSVARLHAEKHHIYTLVASYRRDQNYYDYDLAGNPLAVNAPASFMYTNSSGQISPWYSNTPKFRNSVRQMGDYQLELFPDASIGIRLDYSHNANKGIRDQVFAENLYPIDIQEPISEHEDSYQAGVDFRSVPRTLVSIDEVVDHDKINQSWMDNPFTGVTVGGIPVDIGVPNSQCHVTDGVVDPNCLYGVYYYSLRARNRTTLYTTLFALHSNYFQRLDVSLNGSYSFGEMSERDLNNTDVGLRGLPGMSTFPLTSAFQVTGPADASRISRNTDLGLTYHLTDHWSIIDQFQWLSWNQPGHFDETDMLCYASGGSTPTLVTPIGSPCGVAVGSLPGPGVSGTVASPAPGPYEINTNDISTLSSHDVKNTATLAWTSGPRVSLRVGYRYDRRSLLDGWGNNGQTKYLFPDVTTPVTVTPEYAASPAAYSSDVGTDYGDVGSRRSEATLDCLLQ